ncbi:hypothetical protein FHS81_001942 [Pseudochelatococcus contaminans]|uniref:Uncharacterized protein n=1 Tax=Pseudochelatococcus contaminans TaxID=1538103 RepID=A0A7W6EH26_9HYPH|nr:hypothetical protein [Pseudochelatococcus contaminans]
MAMQAIVSKTPGAGGIGTGSHLYATHNMGNRAGDVGDDSANGHLFAPVLPAPLRDEMTKGKMASHFPPSKDRKLKQYEPPPG